MRRLEPDDDECAQLRASLLAGKQPESVEEYIGVAVGAAGAVAPFGPDTGVYRDDLATEIVVWAVVGIRNLASDGAR